MCCLDVYTFRIMIRWAAVSDAAEVPTDPHHASQHCLILQELYFLRTTLAESFLTINIIYRCLARPLQCCWVA